MNVGGKIPTKYKNLLFFAPNAIFKPLSNFKAIQKRYIINQYIRISPVRVIDDEGKNLGVLPTSEALKLAQDKGLDLIEIVETTTPPIVKIMDLGKFKYEREKGEREHGKKQRESEMKVIRIGFATGKHDLEMRAEQAKKFLERGDKVRVDMRLRGREKALGNVALQSFNGFLKMIPVEFDLEAPPKRFPQGFSATITKKIGKK